MSNVITMKYQSSVSEEGVAFATYVSSLLEHLSEGEYTLDFKVDSSDSMFPPYTIATIDIDKERHAFDVVNHYMMDREMGTIVPESVDLTKVDVYVTGSPRIENYITSKSISSLYEQMKQMQEVIVHLNGKIHEQETEIATLQHFNKKVGIEKFPDIIKTIIESMEAEGHTVKENITEILTRKSH